MPGSVPGSQDGAVLPACLGSLMRETSPAPVGALRRDGPPATVSQYYASEEKWKMWFPFTCS
ncbi:hypothetical protein GCM10009766_00650 [Microcella frigidaquae]